MKKEFKRIKKISKKIIGKRQYKMVKKVRDHVERTKGLKYLVASKLELELLELESKIREIGRKEKTLVLESKMILLPSKIEIFKSTYKKRDYKPIQELIKKIEKDLKCLTS